MADHEEEKNKSIERLITAIDRAYHHPGQLAWRGFLIGLTSGLGATVGAAVVLTLLGFLIRMLGGLPVLGDWLTNVEQSLPTNQFR